MQGISQHVPQRTCAACRQVRPKQELIRLVRIADGAVEVDPKGKTAGRGAYLCRNEQCWGDGLKGNRLDHALKINLSLKNREQLLSSGKKFIGELASGRGK